MPDKVEFILLDYHSTDGLEEWVKTLQNYIDIGILHYYRTDVPAHYHRSHSRNMVFRLSNAEIVCNLDADNYLGKGFAEYVLKEFESTKERILITSDFRNGDIFGRFCALKSDFMDIRGYNELLAGYGNEDSDLFRRMINHGLQHKAFYHRDFYKVITHSYADRITQESYYHSLDNLYLSYLSPFSTHFLALHKDYTYESAILINKKSRDYNVRKPFINLLESASDSTNPIILGSTLQTGTWTKIGEHIQITFNHQPFKFLETDKIIRIEGRHFYKIEVEDILPYFVVSLSTARNHEKTKQWIASNSLVNPAGFGIGMVYKNFDFTNPVTLD